MILARSNTDPEQTLGELRRLAEIIDPPPLALPVNRDASDDAVLALAIASQADLIITGDADLLTLGTMPASQSSIQPKPSSASAARLVARPRRHGIDCPDISGAGSGTFEFEAASGVCTELQCGSDILIVRITAATATETASRLRPSSRASSSGRR